MTKLTLEEATLIEKTEQGININNELVLLKDFALYKIMLIDRLESKEEAQKVWDKLTPAQILINYFSIGEKNE